MIPANHTATLLAVLADRDETGRATVRSVAGRRGVAVSTAWESLKQLRRLGLVTWDRGRYGTLRPTVGQVPFGS